MLNITLYPLVFFDAPQVLDASSTPIPGSASSPLQVIAKTGYDTRAIKYFDGIGKYVGVYVGGAGSETLVAALGGGSADLVECFIKKGSRVSLRSMTSSSISTGTLLAQFMGQKT